MRQSLTRHSVFVKTRNNVLRSSGVDDIFPAMKDGWFARLIEAVNDDSRDYKALSLAAGCGPNYVQQMVKDGKEPTVGRFVKLLGVLGRARSLYIILGSDMTPEDEELIQISANLTLEQKKRAIGLFQSLQVRATTSKPPA